MADDVPEGAIVVPADVATVHEATNAVLRVAYGLAHVLGQALTGGETATLVAEDVDDAEQELVGLGQPCVGEHTGWYPDALKLEVLSH